MYEGRRGRWFCELKLLFGSEFFDHVTYLDTVGSSISGRLQRVVITNRHLYIFNDNTKKKPEPYCLLSNINNLKIDHNVPEAYRNKSEYDPHHISFTVYRIDESKKEYVSNHVDLYTFEMGTDLYWRLKNSIEFAKRNTNLTEKRKKPTPPDMVELVEMDNRTVTVNTYYKQKFNEISSRVAHADSTEEKIEALDELNEVSGTYFPTRTFFFQSSILLTFLTDTLAFLSDFHTIPCQVRSNRLEQIEFIAKIFQTFSIYLQGSSTVPDTTRLITYNKAQHYRALLHSIFQTEFFILSQPHRSSFFLQKVKDKNKYKGHLQEIENASVSLCYQLSVLATLTWRSKSCGISHNFFLEVLKEKEDLIVKGGFHTFVFTLIQMCYLMQDMPELPTFFTHSILDHLWLIDFFMTNIPSAAQLVRKEFMAEIDAIVTEERMRAMIPLNHHVLKDIIMYVNNIRQTVKKTKIKRENDLGLPVQFR